MKNTPLTLLLTITLMAVLSCATTTGSNGSETGEKPGWMTQRPAGSLYYVGIGGSRTGNQADDKEMARSRALSELSSEIFTSIQSSLDIQTTDSSESGESYRVEQNIIQKVQQDLEAVETVDTWYTDEDGYWYYLRLSRADWETIQEKRALELSSRIDEMFSDVFRDTLSELKTIDRAYTEYQDSYTGRKVKMELFGKSGSVDTLLLIRAEELISGLNIPNLPFPDEVTQMEQISLTGKILCRTGRNAGSFQLALTGPEDKKIGLITVAPDGSYEWLYIVGELPGEANYQLELVSPLTNTDLEDKVAYALPRVSRSVLVTPLLVQMETSGSGENGVYERSFEILDVLTPFTLTDKGSDKKIRLSFSFNEAPPNDFGLIISYGRCFLTLITPDGENVIWQSPELKTGGLTETQARSKVTDKLLEQMKNDPDLKVFLREISF